MAGVTLDGTLTLGGQDFDAGSVDALITTTGGARGLQIKSTSGGGNGALLQLYHFSTSPEAGNYPGYFIVTGRNDNSQDVDYFGIEIKASAIGDGIETGLAEFRVRNVGAWNLAMTLSGAGQLTLDLGLTDGGGSVLTSPAINGTITTSGLTMPTFALGGAAITGHAQAISDNALLTVDHVTPVATDYARFTANGLEGREKSEVLGDLNVADGADVTGDNPPQAHTHALVAGATDVTATFGELNLLDLAALTAGELLVATGAATAAWQSTGVVLTAPTLNGTTTLGSTPIFDAGSGSLRVNTTGSNEGIDIYATSDDGGVRCSFYHVTASPVADDIPFQWYVYGKDTGGTQRELATQRFLVESVGATTLAGKMDILLRTGAAWNTALTLSSAGALWIDAGLEVGGDIVMGGSAVTGHAQAITDNAVVTVDGPAAGAPASGEYAKWTASGLEGKSKAEQLSDLNVADGADVTGSNTPQAHKDSHDPGGTDALDTAAPGALLEVQAQAEGSATTFSRADHAHAVVHDITDNSLVTVDGSPNDDEFARFTAAGLEGRTGAEVLSDIGALTAEAALAFALSS